MSDQSNLCSCCGQEHAALPLSLSADCPDAYVGLTDDERKTRASLSSEQCIIDQEQFYVRGCIEIPVRGTDGVFLWGVWAKVEDQVFDAISEHWDSEGRETKIGPYGGLLANSLSIYPKTLNLPLKIQIMPVGVRPLFRLDGVDHSLAIEQKYGITAEHAQEYACHLLRIANS
jgi:hypothetical protein